MKIKKEHCSLSEKRIEWLEKQKPLIGEDSPYTIVWRYKRKM